jgi:hypothetical protein
MSNFNGPSALDLLAQFRRKYVALAERRSAELRVIIDQDKDPDAVMREAYAQYDQLRDFEPHLHRMIAAFVNDAVTPFREALVDMAARQPMKPLVFGGESSFRGEAIRRDDGSTYSTGDMGQ